MQTFQLGDTRVTRIEELIGPLFDPMTFFPTFHQGLVRRPQRLVTPKPYGSKNGSNYCLDAFLANPNAAPQHLN